MSDPILVTKPLMPSLETYQKKLEIIWENQWLTNNGVLHQELQTKLRERMKAQYLELFTNGHMALDIAIKALKLSGEVITTPYSFASTTHSLVLNGIEPVFCDIREDNYTIDETQIESLITPETTAILPVHVYGNSCNTKEIARIARKYDLKVIYDAAHAFGVEVDGEPLVNEGDISMLSFHATKVFNSIEGGALILHEEEHARAVSYLRNFGIENAESVPMVGLNAKMNEFAAAMGLCNLELVDAAVEHRKGLTEYYLEHLAEFPGIKMLDYAGAVKVGVKLNYAYMPVEIDEKKAGFSRNELFDYLFAHDIFARKYFYPLISDYECYRDRFDSSRTPVAKRVADQIITLPMSASTTYEEVERVCEAIKALYVEKHIGR